MRKRNLLWIAGALILIAIPAVVGLVALRDDGGSSARRAAALIPDDPKAGEAYRLTIAGITPAGQAIDVLSFSWGISSPVDATTGAATGSAQVKPLVITKLVDQTSSPLIQHVAQGKLVPTAVLSLAKQTGTGAVAKYMTYTLSDVRVTSVEHAGTAKEIPQESVTLHFQSIKTETSGLDPKGGVSPPTTFTFSGKTAA